MGDEENTNIYAKIFGLQQEMPVMRKDEPGHNYKYYDINQIVEKIKPLLKKYGLMVLQPLDHIEGKPAIRTIIATKDEKLEWITPLPTSSTVTTGQNKNGSTYTITKTDPQDMGANITYYRRYSLVSGLLMEAEDKDGKKTNETNNNGF